MSEDELIDALIYEVMNCLDEQGRMRLMAHLASATFPEHIHAGDLFIVGEDQQRVAIIIASGRHADPVMEMNDQYAQRDALEHPETSAVVYDRRKKQ